MKLILNDVGIASIGKRIGYSVHNAIAVHADNELHNHWYIQHEVMGLVVCGIWSHEPHEAWENTYNENKSFRKNIDENAMRILGIKEVVNENT
jgi:hypothetical protein